jgi:hypothetical protein
MRTEVALRSLPLVRSNRPQQKEAGAAAADRALDSLAALPERRLSKIAHFKLAYHCDDAAEAAHARRYDDRRHLTEANPSVPL